MPLPLANAARHSVRNCTAGTPENESESERLLTSTYWKFAAEILQFV